MKLFQVVAEASGDETMMLYVFAGEPEIALRMVMEDEAKALRSPRVVRTADAVSDFPPRIVATRPLPSREKQ